jgi:hypothetical protein
MRRSGVVAQVLAGSDVDAVVETVTPVQRSSKHRRWTEWEVTARVPDRPEVLAFGSLKSKVDLGEKLHARVPDARPDLALAWVDGDPPSSFFLWLTVALLAGAFGFAFAAVFQNRRDLFLLRDGLLTTGKIIDRQSRKVKQGTVWTLVFLYKTVRAGEQTTRVVVHEKALGRLVDEEAELLVYDPANPSRALLLDALPDHVRAHADGEWTPIPWQRGALRTIPLFLGVAFLVGGVFVLRVLG